MIDLHTGKIGGEGNSHAGAITLTDARILAFPVRSLKGVFAWVTCPAVLERLARDLGLARHPAPPGATPGRVASPSFARDEGDSGEHPLARARLRLSSAERRCRRAQPFPGSGCALRKRATEVRTSSSRAARSMSARRLR